MDQALGLLHNFTVKQEMIMNRLITIARAAALAGLCSGCVVWSAASFAADYDAVPHGTMALHGADFASPVVVARLKHRLDRIATDMCMGDTGSQNYTSRSERACYDTAVKDGLAQIASRQQQAMRERTVRLADSGIVQISVP